MSTRTCKPPSLSGPSSSLAPATASAAPLLARALPEHPGRNPVSRTVRRASPTPRPSSRVPAAAPPATHSRRDIFFFFHTFLFVEMVRRDRERVGSCKRSAAGFLSLPDFLFFFFFFFFLLVGFLWLLSAREETSLHGPSRFESRRGGLLFFFFFFFFFFLLIVCHRRLLSRLRPPRRRRRRRAPLPFVFTWLEPCWGEFLLFPFFFFFFFFSFFVLSWVGKDCKKALSFDFSFAFYDFFFLIAIFFPVTAAPSVSSTCRRRF